MRKTQKITSKSIFSFIVFSLIISGTLSVVYLIMNGKSNDVVEIQSNDNKQVHKKTASKSIDNLVEAQLNNNQLPNTKAISESLNNVVKVQSNNSKQVSTITSLKSGNDGIEAQSNKKDKQFIPKATPKSVDNLLEAQLNRNQPPHTKTISESLNNVVEIQFNGNKQVNEKTPAYFIKETEVIYIVGIFQETSFKEEQHTKDLENLWEKYTLQDPLAKISNKLDDKIYFVYTDYGSDEDDGFTLMMGYRVTNLDAIPSGLSSLTIPTSKYAVFKVSGDLEQNVSQLWEAIEEIDLKRTYSTDIEIYEENSIYDAEGKAEIWTSIE